MTSLHNMTIFKKLIAAFSAVAAITLFLGALGYYDAVRNDQDICEIGRSRLPSVQSLLVINESSQRIKAAQRTFLNPDATNADRKRQLQRIAEARNKYQAAWKIYEPLPHTAEEAAVWQEFVPAWEQWKKDNDDFLKINGEYEAMLEVYSRQARSADLSYRQAIARVCRNADDALVAFKLQVQEWKNILLRGNDSARYDKHLAGFEQAEKTVQAELKKATDLIRQLGLDSKPTENVMQKHAALGVQYREMLEEFRQGQSQGRPGRGPYRHGYRQACCRSHPTDRHRGKGIRSQAQRNPESDELAGGDRLPCQRQQGHGAPR